MAERLRAFALAALAGGTMLVVTERVVVAWTAPGLPPSWRGMAAWWGACVAICALMLACRAVGAAVSARGPEGERAAVARGGLAVGVLLGLIGAPLGDSLVVGGWISQQSWGWLMRGAPSLALATLGGTLAAVDGLVAAGTARGRALAVVLLVASAGLVTVDQHILHGTYPDIHVTILLAAALCAVSGLRRLQWFRPAAHRGRGAIVLAAGVVAAGALWATLPLGHRPALSMASSMAGTLMELTMPRVDLHFAEREFARVDLSEGSYLPAPPGQLLPRTDWNVLWITIDTLRWDALWPARTDRANFAQRSDTPWLNEWLPRTVLFEHAYAQSSATHRSMPPMFRSLEAHEPAMKLGTPLGASASLTGRASFAVVNNFFLEPRYASSQSLLWGFEDVSIYNKEAQEELVPQLDDALRRHAETGFFGWLHFYNMHAPGYGQGGLQSRGAITTRYRRSLQWLDARLREVVDLLERHGVADRTIIVLSADHGEGLGANRIRNHGPTVFEEEVRVPLAFYVPGLPPRRVTTTVGNIDILPTLWDALGQPAAATHRGRSLLPAIVGRPIEERAYYLENSSGTTLGLVLGDQKLVHKRKSGTTMRFDLATDPFETKDRFTDGPDDQALLAALYERNPNLVLATPHMGGQAALALRTMDPGRPGRSLRYVAQIAARSQTAAARDALRDLFAATPYDEVKFEVLAALLTTHEGLAIELARGELRRIEPGREASFVRGLMEIGMPDVGESLVRERFGGSRPIDEATTATWLRWLARWSDPQVEGILVRIAQRTQSGGRAGHELARAMAVLIAATKPRGDARRELLSFNRWLITQQDPRVLPEAIATAGALRDREAFELVRAQAARGPIRARQAALHALAAIDPEAAVDPIVAAAAEPELVLDAVKALEATGNARAIPFVEEIAREHYNFIIRNNAKDALKKLRK